MVYLRFNQQYMTIVKIGIYFLALILSIPSVSANTQADVDSLMHTLKDKKGKVNIDLLIKEGRNQLYTNPELTYQISLKSIELSVKQNDKKNESESYRLLGSYYSDIKGDYESAIKEYQKADKILSNMEGVIALRGKGALHHGYGTIYHRQGNYVNAIDHYTKALAFFDAVGDNIIRSKTLNNLSNLYSFLKDYQKAERYASESFRTAQKNNDEHMVSVTGISMADVLILQGKYAKATKYIEASEKIANKRNDLYILNLVHLNYGNLYTSNKDYEKAVSEYKQAYEYAVSLSNEWEQMRVLTNLSGALISLNKIDESIPNTKEAFRLATKLGSVDFKQALLVNYSLIAANDSNYSEAYDYLNQSFSLRDTLLNEDNIRQVNLLESMYQAEKKELLISALKNERRFYQIIFITITLVSILLIVILFFRQKNIRTKKELAEQKIIKLEKEKQLVATNAILEGETTERSRLARDLHDGLGGMLSAVKLNLFDIKKGNINLVTEDLTRLNKVMMMLDNSMNELRRVAHNMMPESLLRYGLKFSLADFCNDIDNAHFYYFGNETRLESKLEIMIYRSVYELVNNAFKHSEAENINVQIVQETDRISITVQDDGKGFDPNAITKGSGLNNIKNRVISVNGIMNVFSDPQKGTEINIELNI